MALSGNSSVKRKQDSDDDNQSFVKKRKAGWPEFKQIDDSESSDDESSKDSDKSEADETNEEDDDDDENEDENEEELENGYRSDDDQDEDEAIDVRERFRVDSDEELEEPEEQKDEEQSGSEGYSTEYVINWIEYADGTDENGREYPSIDIKDIADNSEDISEVLDQLVSAIVRFGQFAQPSSKLKPDNKASPRAILFTSKRS